MENSKGLVTIPTDLDVVPETLELMKRWGAGSVWLLKRQAAP